MTYSVRRKEVSGALLNREEIEEEEEDASQQPDEQIDESTKRKKRVKKKRSVADPDEGGNERPRTGRIVPSLNQFVGRGSDPISQGATHHCEGVDCVFCYSRSQCDNCNGRGCHICYMVSENLKQLRNHGAISINRLREPDHKEIGPTTDQPTENLDSKAVDSPSSTKE